MKKLFRTLGLGVFYLLIVVVSLEAMYRFQVVDSYRPELKSFNPPEVLQRAETGDEPDTILVLGDSFTAGLTNFPGEMRPLLPEYRIINGGISGTGIFEAEIVAPRRFKEFQPEIFIYQIYVGNDLLNITQVINWSDLGVIRNSYWVLTSYLKSLVFLNYRFGQLFKKNLTAQEAVFADTSVQKRTRTGKAKGELMQEFSPDKYTLRDILYLKGDPRLLEDAVLVNDRREGDYETLLTELSKLLDRCKPSVCRSYVLVVPHAIQTSEQYLADTQQLGAKFSVPEQMMNADYPFVAGIKRFLLDESIGNATVLDPLELFQKEEAAGNHVYFQNDSHLNNYGKRVLAEFISEQIQAD